MKKFLLIFVMYLSLNSVKAQNLLDSLISRSNVCFLDQKKLESFNVKEIKIYTFLDEQERKTIPSSKDIRSKVTVYKYLPAGKIKEIERNYSGMDETGNDRLLKSGKTEELNINGMIYYYNNDGKVASTLSYGAGVTPNSGYIYDHEGQLVMIRYYYDKVIHPFSESAGRTIFDYFPQNGKIKYRIKLDNNGAIEKSEYFIYDNYWKLKGIANAPDEVLNIKPYKPYTDLGKIAPWQILINNIPVNNFLYNIKAGKCTGVVVEAAPEQYFYFKM